MEKQPSRRAIIKTRPEKYLQIQTIKPYVNLLNIRSKIWR